MLWAALVIATPLLAESSAGDDARLRVATLAYVVGSFICHQRPERSFHVRGMPFPVCGRCCGIYIGSALVVIAFAISPRLRRALSSRTDRWWRTALLTAAAPTALTLIAEWVVRLPVSNVVRAVSGAVVGGAVAAFVLTSLAVPVRGDSVAAHA